MVSISIRCTSEHLFQLRLFAMCPKEEAQENMPYDCTRLMHMSKTVTALLPRGFARIVWRGGSYPLNNLL
jgi:hypothetical protein